MRPLFPAAAALVLAAAAAAQDESARYDILYNPDLYRQDTPQ